MLNQKEQSYLDAYALSKEGEGITERGRKLLDMQASALGLEAKRIAYLEEWYNTENQSVNEQ